MINPIRASINCSKWVKWLAAKFTEVIWPGRARARARVTLIRLLLRARTISSSNWQLTQTTRYSSCKTRRALFQWALTAVRTVTGAVPIQTTSSSKFKPILAYILLTFLFNQIKSGKPVGERNCGSVDDNGSFQQNQWTWRQVYNHK